MEILDRRDEILELISLNSLNQATKRLIDFVNEYSDDKEMQKSSVIIRSNYAKLRNDLNQIGRSDYAQSLENQLMSKMIDLLTSVVDEYDRISRNFELNSRALFTTLSEKIKKEKNTHPKQLVELKHVSKSYSGFNLVDISININSSEIIGLVGRNGSGKSTLLKLLAKKISMDSGSIFYKFEKEGKYLDLLNNIIYVPQDIIIKNSVATVEKELSYYLGAHGIRGQKNTDLIEQVLMRLELDEYAESLPSTLSGGYKLRFELAKVFAIRPKLIILDEPLANLDINAQKVFLEDIVSLANSYNQEIAIIISSQHLEEIESIADKILFLEKGKPLFYGSVDEVGMNRRCNIVEISTNANYSVLLDTLKGIDNEFRLKKSGVNYVVEFDKGLTINEFIKALIDRKIDLHYFRDISRSTKMIFEQLKIN